MLATLEALLAVMPTSGWAAIGGALAAGICAVLTAPAMTVCEAKPGRWPQMTTAVGLALGALLAVCMTEWQCQLTPVVRPDEFARDLRVYFHVICLGLLIVITATDLTTLYIPDFVVQLGIVIGLTLATWSGQLQMEHVWVDWNQEIPQIRGPYIPEWLKHSQHWHGMAWSGAGIAVGIALTAVIRKVAEIALGRPAMGAGDVTLMGMVGAFLGWQATVIAFFLAPILALALAPLARRVSKEQAVPYGPFLALGAVIVMFSWRWIWMLEFNFGTSDPSHVDDWSTSFAVRRLFGDWVLLSGLAVVAIGGTAGLMGLMRIFWTLPVEREPEKLEADRSGKLDG